MLRFRLDFIKSLIDLGMKVSVSFPQASGDAADLEQAHKTFKDLNVPAYALSLDRAGLNLLSDLKYRQQLKRTLEDSQPQLVYAYGIKPILHALPIAQGMGIKTVAMIAGLGSAFDPIKSIKSRVIQAIAVQGYKRALARADHVFFQNPDDRNEFLERKIISATQATSLTAGSGVNQATFPQAEFPSTEPGALTFLMVGRLIRQKGVLEYARAAQSLAQPYPKAQFLLAGGTDDNANSLTSQDLAAYPALNWLGSVDDIPALLCRSHAFVLPSYYREGTPRSALEAMSTGRAVILADSPGTREAVVHEETGIMVEPRSAWAVRSAMELYLKDPALCKHHGQAGYELVKRKFSVQIVNDHLIQTITALL